ncbi:hypothetical protein IX308_000448 [Porphyromonas levii]|uniref:hypothetical protein n=1 Tax=Porphyromonas levii TaxID=28114 RepID=UPI001BA719DA|nr:hypothetical protein [Porphyromonas levii]MBR8784279.1 hypothetical protein [Porphyromonas levii]
MLDPVEIPININGNAAEESKSIAQSIDGVADSSRAAERELKRSIALQQQHLARLKKEIAHLEQTIKESPKATAKLSQSLSDLKRELIDETQGLKHLQAELRLTSQAKETLQTKMYNVRDEMARLRQVGGENSEQYRQLRAELEQLNIAYQGVVREQQLMTKGSAAMTGVISGLQGFLGVVTSAAGAVGVLSGESERFAEIQTKVQSLLAITIGLQQAQQAFSSTSAFRVHTLSKAKEVYTRVLQRMTVAMGGSATAAKVMMGAMTAGIGLLVGWGITALDKYISKQKQAQMETEAFNASVSRQVGSTIAKFEQMRQSYVALGDDIDAKTKFVRQGQKDFEGLGVAVADAHEADNLFIGNADAFRQAVLERAKATAAMELASEAYKKAIEKMLEAEERGGKTTFFDRLTATMANSDRNRYGYGKSVAAEDLARDAARRLRVEAERGFENADRFVAKYLQFASKYDAVIAGAGISPLGREGVAGTKSAERDLERVYQRLAKISEDAERDSGALALAAMEEGRQKRLAKLRQEYDERKTLIMEQLDEIGTIEAKHGVDVSPQRVQLNKLSSRVDDDYNRQVADVNTASDAVMQEIQAEMDRRFATKLDQRLAQIDDYYSKLQERARASAENEGDLAEASVLIERNRLQERELAQREHELRQIDLEERTELRRIQMSDKRYATRAHREEEFLRRQLELAEQRLAKLMEIEAAGGDAAEDIRQVKAEMRELSEELKKMPVKKLEELANGMRSIFASLSSVGGEVGEVFGALSSSVDRVVTSMRDGANAVEVVSAGISGLAQIWGMARQQVEENRKAIEEYNASLSEAEHRQRMLHLATLEYKGENIFGIENPYARAIAGAKQYSEAMTALYKGLRQMEQGRVQTGTRKVVSGKNVATGTGGGAAVGAAIGSFIPGIGNLIGAGIGAGIGAVFGAVFGATRKKIVPIFDSLVKTYGSILKAGTKTFELNPEILANYKRLDDHTKKLVDNWEEIRKKALEAEQQMKETFKSLAGDLGQTLSQTLINAWRNGDIYDAVDDYAEHVNKVIEGIIEQMVFAQHFQSLFDQLEKRMTASYGESGDGSIVDDIIWFSKTYKEGVEAFGRDMDLARQELAKQGIKAFEATDTRRQAAARGIARASQDDITKFNGQMTLVVEKVGTIVSIMEVERTMSVERLNVMRAIFSEVQTIARNTAFLSALADIKSDIRIIRTEGTKLKK